MTNFRNGIADTNLRRSAMGFGASVALVVALIIGVMGMAPAQAEMRIKVTKGQIRGIPVAVVPFGIEGATGVSQDIAAVIEADLTNSGRFEPIPRTDHLSAPSDAESVKFKDFRLLKAEAMVIGKVIQQGPDNFRVEYRLFDVFRGTEGQLDSLVWQNIPGSELRRVAHQIADRVHKQLTGVDGAFDTLIAYVTKSGEFGSEQSQLVISDYDGYDLSLIHI